MDAQYSAISNGSLLEKVLVSQRRKLFNAFMTFKGGADNDTILDVGTMPAPFPPSSNYLLAWTDPQQRSNITFCGIAPANDKARYQAYPDSRQKSYRQVVGLPCAFSGGSLPFADGQFDWVFCNAVLEHIDGFDKQYELLKELARVSRKGVFVTTPNRRHPVEFYTGLPLLHWLPGVWWRRILKWSGKGAWASKSALNLVDSSTLKKLTSLLPGKPESDIGHIRFLGIKAHFFLMIQKNPAILKMES